MMSQILCSNRDALIERLRRAYNETVAVIKTFFYKYHSVTAEVIP